MSKGDFFSNEQSKGRRASERRPPHGSRLGFSLLVESAFSSPRDAFLIYDEARRQGEAAAGDLAFVAKFKLNRRTLADLCNQIETDEQKK